MTLDDAKASASCAQNHNRSSFAKEMASRAEKYNRGSTTREEGSTSRGNSPSIEPHSPIFESIKIFITKQNNNLYLLLNSRVWEYSKGKEDSEGRGKDWGKKKFRK